MPSRFCSQHTMMSLSYYITNAQGATSSQNQKIRLISLLMWGLEKLEIKNKIV